MDPVGSGPFQLYLVDGRAHGPLEDHLQHLGVGGVLVRGEGQLLSLLLHVFDRHLDGRGYDLEGNEPNIIHSWR